MSYFTQEYIDFFKDLAANNDRDWFHANKKRYEQYVKNPFQDFVTDLIAELDAIEGNIKITYKEAMFRINRDIRFSKDKSPYKLNLSAVISPGGRKDMVNPGMYIELGPEFAKVYGGLYMLDKEQLHKVRSYIIKNSKKLDELLADLNFQKTFETLSSREKNKVLPKEFKAAAEKQPILYNKAFYFFHKMPARVITKKNFKEMVLEDYETGRPMTLFLKKAIGAK